VNSSSGLYNYEIAGAADTLYPIMFIPDNNRVLMPRPKNSSPGDRFEVTLSVQSIGLLRSLAKRGIYGRTPAEVGGRFIEQALQQFVQPPSLTVPVPSSRKKRDLNG